MTQFIDVYVQNLYFNHLISSYNKIKEAFNNNKNNNNKNTLKKILKSTKIETETLIKKLIEIRTSFSNNKIKTSNDIYSHMELYNFEDSLRFYNSKYKNFLNEIINSDPDGILKLEGVKKFQLQQNSNKNSNKNNKEVLKHKTQINLFKHNLKTNPLTYSFSQLSLFPKKILKKNINNIFNFSTTSNSIDCNLKDNNLKKYNLLKTYYLESNNLLRISKFEINVIVGLISIKTPFCSYKNYNKANKQYKNNNFCLSCFYDFLELPANKFNKNYIKCKGSGKILSEDDNIVISNDNCIYDKEYVKKIYGNYNMEDIYFI